MHCSRIAAYVFLKTFYEKRMDDLGLVMRNLFGSEARVKLQSVATGAIGGELDRFHRGRVVRTVKSGGGNQISGVGGLIGFACEVVAIFASHLHSLPIRAHEVGLQVEKVVQPKLAWITQLLR